MQELVELLERIADSLEGIESSLNSIQDDMSGIQLQNDLISSHLDTLVSEMNWTSPTSAISQIKSELESLSNR